MLLLAHNHFHTLRDISFEIQSVSHNQLAFVILVQEHKTVYISIAQE